jgi:hypothetical protein
MTVDLGDATCPDGAWPWDSDVPLHGRFDPYAEAHPSRGAAVPWIVDRPSPDIAHHPHDGAVRPRSGAASAG